MMTCTPMTDGELARLGSEGDAGFGALDTARGRLPLTAMTVTAHVVGLVAEIELAQTFANRFAEPIEATYIFPLPDRAAVTRFRMEVADRVVEGVIEERACARQQYEDAIEAGHRAAITEEDRPGVFTMRIGNLAPGDVAVVRLHLVGPLPVDDGEVTFRFPLVVAPRYIPGQALPGPRAGAGTEADTDAVPDASRITPPVLLPGFPNPVRLAMTVTVDGAGAPIGAVRSSLHAVSDEAHGGVRTISLSPGERLDRDFILSWSVGDSDVGTSAIVVADAEGGEGTVVLTLVPPKDEAPRRPCDAVFVLDRSGSMGGWKMVAARRACARMIDTLGERDRFSVLVFHDSIESPPTTSAGLIPGSDRHRFRAIEFLAGVEARGGTELREPLRRAAEMLSGAGGERDRVLIVITDGQVGNEDQILRELTGRLKTIRVFTLGVDQAVNAAFLRRLAAAGGGACELVESEDRLDAVMSKLHHRIATPVVTDVAIHGDGFSLGQVSPQRIPALVAGAPLIVTGRVAAGARGTVIVTGRTPGGQPWERRLALRESEGAAAAATWARARIRDLEDRYAAGDHSVESEILRVSIRHRVLSRFTAFVAIDQAGVIDRGGNPRAIVQPVEMPAGWAARAAGAAPSIGSFTGGGPSRRLSRTFVFDATQVRPALARERVFTGAPTPVDETPYLTRAREIADAIDHAAGRCDRRELDLALARLVELVEDLRSIGGLDKLAAVLERIADALRAELAGTPDRWRTHAAELRDPRSTRPAKRRPFWK